jgi:hypothetical protein
MCADCDAQFCAGCVFILYLLMWEFEADGAYFLANYDVLDVKFPLLFVNDQELEIDTLYTINCIDPLRCVYLLTMPSLQVLAMLTVWGVADMRKLEEVRVIHTEEVYQ